MRGAEHVAFSAGVGGDEHSRDRCRDGGFGVERGIVMTEVLTARAEGGDAVELDDDVAGVFAGSGGHSDVDVGVAPVEFLAGCACTAADCV
ncbi:hypothetical protein [Microbacterium sp.]|uniref:hypothetical protein n=1 Tax=Microbacterium sp. TaxID=51671 RepID=UPI00281109F7|nr:hypothetical protein [Microbacterium sp.]